MYKTVIERICTELETKLIAPSVKILGTTNDLRSPFDSNGELMPPNWFSIGRGIEDSFAKKI